MLGVASLFAVAPSSKVPRVSPPGKESDYQNSKSMIFQWMIFIAATPWPTCSCSRYKGACPQWNWKLEGEGGKWDQARACSRCSYRLHLRMSCRYGGEFFLWSCLLCCHCRVNLSAHSTSRASAWWDLQSCPFNTNGRLLKNVLTRWLSTTSWLIGPFGVNLWCCISTFSKSCAFFFACAAGFPTPSLKPVCAYCSANWVSAASCSDPFAVSHARMFAGLPQFSCTIFGSFKESSASRNCLYTPSCPNATTHFWALRISKTRHSATFPLSS